ncbi:type I inositol-1,4,5-trisphosphate 5-phosphatase [Musa troglodytarum]|uniref:Type I inositol-1,4,5-trisphosphate 5-phosphatase n=1 Tax=Musa troglodytarum TaxID=320322 RepID=A0A9E7I880_9LILI|nr:type I inositol-1,4,5-trisphosphate 5-phosphatase [Musa troglodytarum]
MPTQRQRLRVRLIYRIKYFETELITRQLTVSHNNNDAAAKGAAFSVLPASPLFLDKAIALSLLRNWHRFLHTEREEKGVVKRPAQGSPEDMSQTPKKPGELLLLLRVVQVFWPKIVLKKWLNIRANDSEFSADEGGNDSDLDQDEGGEYCGCEGNEERRARRLQAETNDDNLESIPYKLRRRNSETLRSQVCVGTWNVGGQHPPEDLDIVEWLDTEEPADIYALGIQEIVPLNAGNIFGAEDSGPVAKWERLIRKTLNRIQPIKPKYKCYSDPPSPSRFEPSEDVHFTVDELLSETNSDTDDDDEISTSSVDSKVPVASYLDRGESNMPRELDQNMPPAIKRLQRLNHFTSFDYDVNSAATTTIQEKKLLRTLSTSERIGLVWPEQPLDLLAKHALNNSSSFRSIKSFRTYNSFKPVHSKLKDSSEVGLVPDLDLNVIGFKKKMLAFVRIISKQMVGIYLSIWVRRSLRKHIQNLKVSTVGVGVMGYIGNKGSISVSMSIYQTPFCFVCSHLSSGEKSGDELRRNADVQEIHRRTQFSTVASAGLPKTIHDHERIFWLGDLNYRVDLSFEKTHELIASGNWTLLAERDQLKRELKKGRAFDGWTEGVMNFPPTYKYEFNSTNYVGDDQKGGRRNPAWCDRILSFGKGVRLLDYKRAELKLSDHRPVTAVFMAEVEVFCHRKLQKALTLTDAEVEDGETMPDVDFTLEMGLGDVSFLFPYKISPDGCGRPASSSGVRLLWRSTVIHPHPLMPRTSTSCDECKDGGSDPHRDPRPLNWYYLGCFGFIVRPRSVVGYIRRASAGDLSRNSQLSCTNRRCFFRRYALVSSPTRLPLFYCYSEVVANQNLESSLRLRFLKPKMMVFDVGGKKSATNCEGAWRTAAFGLYGFTQFTKSGFQEHSKKFKEEDMQVHMEGKNCMVTGANSGIGYATVEGLASRGATVYMVCRSKERGEAALSKIQLSTGNPNIHLEICDLSSINQVQAFVSRFSAQEKPLHVLVNNAGVLEHNRVTTPEGLELNFAVNVAATYALTELIMPLLEKAAPDARVITVSSGGMYTTPLTPDLQFSESNFDGTLQYARNKRVQVALTEKWAETYSGKGVDFYSMHPGWADTPGVAQSLPGFSERLSGKLRTNNEGADTVIWLALQPKEKLKSGAFYFDRAEAPKHLLFAGTARSHAGIHAIVDSLRSLCKLP